MITDNQVVNSTQFHFLTLGEWTYFNNNTRNQPAAKPIYFSAIYTYQ